MESFKRVFSRQETDNPNILTNDVDDGSLVESSIEGALEIQFMTERATTERSYDVLQKRGLEPESLPTPHPDSSSSSHHSSTAVLDTRTRTDLTTQTSESIEICYKENIPCHLDLSFDSYPLREEQGTDHLQGDSIFTDSTVTSQENVNNPLTDVNINKMPQEVESSTDKIYSPKKEELVL